MRKPPVGRMIEPGAHGKARATAMADKLGIDFALIHRKRRSRAPDAPEQMELLVGDVRGKVRPDFMAMTHTYKELRSPYWLTT